MSSNGPNLQHSNGRHSSTSSLGSEPRTPLPGYESETPPPEYGFAGNACDPNHLPGQIDAHPSTMYDQSHVSTTQSSSSSTQGYRPRNGSGTRLAELPYRPPTAPIGSQGRPPVVRLHAGGRNAIMEHSEVEERVSETTTELDSAMNSYKNTLHHLKLAMESNRLDLDRLKFAMEGYLATEPREAETMERVTGNELVSTIRSYHSLNLRRLELAIVFHELNRDRLHSAIQGYADTESNHSPDTDLVGEALRPFHNQHSMGDN